MANTDWKAYGVNILGSKEALLQNLHSIKAQCLKITEKVSLKITSAESFIYTWVAKNSLKMPKIVNFGEFYKKKCGQTVLPDK